MPPKTPHNPRQHDLRPSIDATPMHDYRNINAQLFIRRQAIRRLLLNQDMHNPLPSIPKITKALELQYQIHVHKDTVNNDLKALGAQRVRNLVTGLEYWILPNHAPQIAAIRAEMPQDIILEAVASKIENHVLDMYTKRDIVFMACEPRAGYLVAYWVSWLNWPEIVLVQEQMDSVIVHCLNERAAEETLIRLTGQHNLHEGEDDDNGTQDQVTD